MPFLSPLKVQFLSDQAKFPWITLEPLLYESEIADCTFEVPKNFRTDGASVPKALVALPVVGPALFLRYFGQGVWMGFKQGVLHDFLRRKVGGTPPVPAKMAHLVFREALVEGGYPEDLVENYYEAVRRFNP
jgi:hypothetical protein